MIRGALAHHLQARLVAGGVDGRPQMPLKRPKKVQAPRQSCKFPFFKGPITPVLTLFSADRGGEVEVEIKGGEEEGDGRGGEMTQPLGERGRQTCGWRGEIQKLDYEKCHIWQKNKGWKNLQFFAFLMHDNKHISSIFPAHSDLSGSKQRQIRVLNARRRR